MTNDFKPVRYTNTLSPSLTIQATREGSRGQPEEFEIRFVNGVFEATTPELYDEMERALHEMARYQPSVRARIRAIDQSNALSIVAQHQAQVRRVATQGPVTTADFVNREAQNVDMLAERAAQDARDAGADPDKAKVGFLSMLQGRVKPAEDPDLNATGAEIDGSDATIELANGKEVETTAITPLPTGPES